MYQKIKILTVLTLFFFTSCSNHNKNLNSKVTKPNSSLIKIATDSKRYKVGESIDIEATSTKSGFVNIFILNPKSQIMKITSPIKKSFRTYLKTKIVGEYKIIAIYTPKKVNIKKEDFSIKNLKEEDIYDIYTFKINN